MIYNNACICHDVLLRIRKGERALPAWRRHVSTDSTTLYFSVSLLLAPQLLVLPKIELPKALPSALFSFCDCLHVYILAFDFCAVDSPLHLYSLTFPRSRCQLPSRHLPLLVSVFPKGNTLQHPVPFSPFSSGLPNVILLFSESLKLDPHTDFSSSFCLAMNLTLESSPWFRTPLPLHSHYNLLDEFLYF